MTPQDTNSSEVTRRVTDKDTTHGSGKARGRVRFGTETAAVVAAHPSGNRPMVIRYRVFDGANNFDRHQRRPRLWPGSHRNLAEANSNLLAKLRAIH